MIKKFLLSALLIATLSSCATQKMVLTQDHAKQPKRLAYQGSAHFVIHGIYQRYSFDAAKHCGGVENIHSTEVGRTAGQVLTTFFTAGVYAPKFVRIYCKK